MKVSQLILRVADMDRSLSFYRDRVGLGVVSESASFSFLDAGTINVALNAAPNQSIDTTNTELVLEVEDILAAHAAMTARGVPFEVEPREVMRSAGRSLLAAHFRDPDGHLTSITGWREPQE